MVAEAGRKNGLKVLVVDDNRLARGLIIQALSRCPELELSHVENPDALLAQASNNAVVLLNLHIRFESGLHYLDQLMDQYPLARVVVYSLCIRDVGFYFLAKQRGAKSFIMAGDEPEDLVKAVRCAAEDRHYVSPATKAQFGEDTLKASMYPLERLSGREHLLLVMMARGCSNKTIACEMGQKTRTIEDAQQNLRKKLGARNAEEFWLLAIAYAEFWRDVPRSVVSTQTLQRGAPTKTIWHERPFSAN